MRATSAFSKLRKHPSSSCTLELVMSPTSPKTSWRNCSARPKFSQPCSLYLRCKLALFILVCAVWLAKVIPSKVSIDDLYPYYRYEAPGAGVLTEFKDGIHKFLNKNVSLFSLSVVAFDSLSLSLPPSPPPGMSSLSQCPGPSLSPSRGLQ